MKRSEEDIDRLLRDWDAVASTARQPAIERRRGVALRGSVPVSLVLVVAVAIAVVAIVGRGPNAGPAASPSAGTVAGGAVSDIVDDGEFRLTLTADRAAYVEGDAITAEATVEYVGARASRTVSHAASPVTFSVAEVDGQRHVGGAQALVLVETTYERGVPVTYPWTKSGGTSGDAANDPFVRWYLAQDALVLPAGTWRLGVTFADTREASVTIRVAAGVAGESPSPARAVIRDDTFELALTLDRDRYTAGQDILGEATVTYLGPDGEIRVTHGGSPVLFTVREVGGTREALGGMDTPCLRSTWARDVAQPFPWSRSGGYSNTNPSENDRFVAAYLGDGPPGGLRLPAGTWRLAVTLLVTPGGTCGDSQPMTVDLTITVDPATAAASPDPSAPGVTPAVTPGATAPPATPGVGPTSEPSIAPSTSPPVAGMVRGPVVRCGRISAEACEGAIALARATEPGAYGMAELIVVDDTCAPGSVCDRQYPFETLVVLVPPVDTELFAVPVRVTGADGPESATRAVVAIPSWMQETIDARLRISPGVELFRIAAGLPRLPGEVPACPAAEIRGFIAEDAVSGIGLEDPTFSVVWPFGWAGQRDARGAALVDITGDEVGRVGDRFAGGGGYAGDPEVATICR